jgi:DNA-binding LytR/AlgR family response regulator
MKILIIEDELIIAKRLKRMTIAFFEGKNISIHHCDSLADGQAFLENNTIDLLCLDLNLNGEDGFEVLQNLSAASFHTIIISAYKDKAITAFEYGVLDFVAKPFNEKRLAQAFSRITNKAYEKTPSLKYLSIQKKGRQLLIDINQLIYIKGARVYTELYLRNDTTEIHNKSLDKLEQLLPARFVRIHKSYIADMKQSKGILTQSGGKYTLVLNSGEELPISRGKYKELKGDWFF